MYFLLLCYFYVVSYSRQILYAGLLVIVSSLRVTSLVSAVVDAADSLTWLTSLEFLAGVATVLASSSVGDMSIFCCFLDLVGILDVLIAGCDLNNISFWCQNI